MMNHVRSSKSLKVKKPEQKEIKQASKMTTPAINDETQPAARGTFAAYSTHIAVGDTVIAYSV